MKIVNINYKGRVKSETPILGLKKVPPYMSVYTNKDGEKLLVFKSGKCRVMGCKKPFNGTFPVPIEIQEMQSVTVSMDLGHCVNLYQLSKRLTCKNCEYEPELFPALRLTSAFNPSCVNVFASGKIMILGLKTFDIEPICKTVKQYIYKHL